MAGRPKHPANLDDVIWRLVCEGNGPTRIRDRLAAGDAEGLERPVTISIRTIIRRRDTMKALRGEPVPPVSEGQERATVAALERDVLTIARHESRLIKAKQRSAPLSQQDIGKLAKLATMIRVLRSPPIGSRPGPRSKSGADPSPDPSSVLDDMSADEPASDDSPLSEGEANGVDHQRGARQETTNSNGDGATRSRASEDIPRQADLSAAHA